MPFHEPKNHSLLESIDLVGTSKLQAYVVYEDRDEQMWWQKPLKKGFKHSFLVIYDGYFWIKMELTIGFMDICVLPFYNNNTIEDILRGTKCTYQLVQVWRRQRYRNILAPWSCIEAIKAALGIRALHVLTPYQLFKYIEAHHGKENTRTITLPTKS